MSSLDVCQCLFVVILSVVLQVTEEKVLSLLKAEDTSDGLKKQESIYQQVKINVGKQHARVRKRKAQTGQQDHFVVGDVVLRKNIRQEQRKGGKLEADLLGALYNSKN